MQFLSHFLCNLLMAQSDLYAMGPDSSMVFNRFLDEKLDSYRGIRGQVIGPVNFGLRILDEEGRPIIYNNDVKSLLFDFLQRKVNVQYRQLTAKNVNAFVWLDEPGLGQVFSSFSGYTDLHAKEDYATFLSGIEGPKALHLCLNVNLPYLLDMGLDILSFDAYQLEIMPLDYVGPIALFLHKGGILSWGIVPTSFESLERETPSSLAGCLKRYWKTIAENSYLSERQIAKQALIAPSKCCIRTMELTTKGPGVDSYAEQISGMEEIIIERAFLYAREVSDILRREFVL